MVEISVIVPVYNVDQYLEECLDSIVGQEFGQMQVICIDDNSTDRSLSILEQYARKYSCIEVYHNDKNLGLAQTRNLGMAKAEGEYILFVDSDDYLMPNILMELYEECRIHNLDLLEFDAESFADAGYDVQIDTQTRIHKYQYCRTTGMELLRQLIDNKEMSGCVWMRMYRRNYIIKHQLRFIRGILHEDIPFSFRALIMAERVGFRHKTVYRYRQRQGSIMHDSEYGQHWKGMWIGYMDMLCSWHEFQAGNACEDSCYVCIENYLDMILDVTKNYYSVYCMGNLSSKDRFIEYLDRKCFVEDESLYDFFTTEDVARLLESGNLLIFGAGRIAKKVIRLLKWKNVCIQKIYVTEKEENEDFVAGIKVEQIDTYKKIKGDVMVLAAAANAQDEIERTIRNYYEGDIIKTTKK